jgi:two-component system response regulator AtoC
LADGGTLFLDEITEMPIGLQAKLLRALQEGVVERLGSNRAINLDLRVVAATNRDPMQAVQEGKLREDLYYRLNVFRIELPPLRDRASDIALLATHFLGQRNQRLNEDALTILRRYDWPGNVRELENVLQRAAIVSGEALIEPHHLPADILSRMPPVSVDSPLPADPDNLSMPLAIEALEVRMIKGALERSKGNKSQAARLLDISERSLWYKLSRYKIGQDE